MHLNSKIIGWSLLVVIIGSAVYSLFFTAPDTTSTGSTETAQGVGAEFLALKNRLEGINFDSELFSNKSFLDLIDFSIILPVPNLGRPDPFNRIGVDVGTVPAPKTGVEALVQ